METDPLILFQKAPRGLDRADLRAFAEKLRDEVAGGRPFCVLLAPDTELQRLNREFLGKDKVTDVLSFPSGSEIGGLGDIAIAMGLAAEQATARGHAIEEEVKILMLHGVLHLLGHDHETDEGRMAGLEARLRRKFGLGAGLIERTTGRGGRPAR